MKTPMKTSMKTPMKTSMKTRRQFLLPPQRPLNPWWPFIRTAFPVAPVVAESPAENIAPTHKALRDRTR